MLHCDPKCNTQTTKLNFSLDNLNLPSQIEDGNDTKLAVYFLAGKLNEKIIICAGHTHFLCMPFISSTWKTYNMHFVEQNCDKLCACLQQFKFSLISVSVVNLISKGCTLLE